MTDMDNLGIACGHCEGPLYMETCEIPGHDWAIASECQRCGIRYDIGECLDCNGSTP